MSFWDSSAVVPLCIREKRTDNLKVLQESDRRLTVWWGTTVECTSAFARRRREDRRWESEERAALERLGLLAEMWTEVGPTTPLRHLAIRLVRVHALSAADAFQLAAALEWCDGKPGGIGFVSLDDRLAEAARLEGFSVLPE